MPRATHSDSVVSSSCGCVGKLRVQRAQKVIAVERIVLPRVLAIERDQHGVTGLAGVVPRELRQLADEIARGIVAMPGGVGEADAIRQTRRRGNSSACASRLQCVRLVERGVPAAGTLARNTLALDAIQLKPARSSSSSVPSLIAPSEGQQPTGARRMQP